MSLLQLRRALDPARCGGKAHGLARASAMNLRVPPGWVVPAGVCEQVLGPARLARLSSLLAAADERAQGQAAQEARAIVLGAELPRWLRQELAAALRELGAPAFAVRSSAVGEDGTRDSFAGLLDTRGPVPERAVERALLEVWASRWSERALVYERARGRPLGGVAVILQAWVPAAVSGVLFTRDPEGRDGALLEWVAGPGEGLVCGRQSPARARLERRGPGVERLAAGEAPALPDATLRAVAALGAALERDHGAPQDVEWALDGQGALHLLQTRPITTLSGPLHVFSSSNLRENYPEPVVPLLASIARLGYQHYFQGLGRALGVSPARLRRMAPVMEQLVATHAGRIYYDLTNIHAAIRLLPLGEHLAAAFDQYVGTPLAPDAPTEPPARQPLAGLRLTVLAAWRLGSLPRRVARFERRARAFAADTHPRHLESRSLAGLRADLRAFLALRARWTDAALADLACTVTSAALKAVLRRAFPARPALAGTLLTGMRDLVSGDPARELFDLSRLVRADPALRAAFAACAGPELLERLGSFPAFQRGFEAALESWGFRSSGELLLTRPSWQEQPAALLDLLRGYVLLDGPSPREALAATAALREAETSRVARELGARAVLPLLGPPLRATAFRGLLRATHGALALRERARLAQALVYARLRRIALQCGERLSAEGWLARASDALFLTHEELLGEPTRAWRAMVARRRAEYAAAFGVEAPEVLVLPAGVTYRGRAALSSGAAADEAGLAGTPACGGVATGPAAVLEDVRQAGSLQRGAVLVVRQTDPGWAPALFLASGLVVECGGLLSHGAILARELGLPAVVGVPHATRRIESGALITVDGDRGRVERSGCAG